MKKKTADSAAGNTDQGEISLFDIFGEVQDQLSSEKPAAQAGVTSPAPGDRIFGQALLGATYQQADKLATSGEETKTFDIVNPRAEKRSGESGPGCSSVHLKAVSTGFARLALTYTYTNLDGKTSVALKDNVHVAAYETLSPIQVGSLINKLFLMFFL